mgnify:CR=1 FL=1
MWLNNPVRPLEACGTSGMKAALNGVLNFSILDGWWAEACEHGVNGWAIGDETAGDDQQDLEALYQTLERQVLPAWDDRARWTGMMMAQHRYSPKSVSPRIAWFVSTSNGSTPTAPTRLHCFTVSTAASRST